MLKWFRRSKKEVETVDSPDAAPPTIDAIEEAQAIEPEVTFDIEPNTVAVQPPPPSVHPEDIPAPHALPSIETFDSLPTPPASPTPAEKKGLFARLRDRLGKTKSTLVDKVKTALRLHGTFDEELLEEIEMILVQSDVGVPTTQKIIERLRVEVPKQGSLNADAVLVLFKQALEDILSTNNRTLNTQAAHPTIMLVVGVNGTGKTTTIGKLAKQLTDRKLRVMMVAGDTFRAAAIEQLTVWAERTGSCIVRQEQGADPAAVVFEALEGAKLDPPDVILIDTAGRLQTKTHLMEELRKIVRIIKKHYPAAPHETILVLDATTGQNALSQIKLFHEVCELSGLIMSKLDGTAKGGILVACKDLYQLPVFKIGIGEGVEDLRDFDAHEFVEALFSSPSGSE